MAEGVGRDVAVTRGGSAIAGLREKGITLNGEPVDVTSDDDDGRRKLIDVTKRDEVNISISGVTKDETLKVEWFSRARLKTTTFTWPNGATMTGSFYLANFVETEPYEDAITFTAELRSSGEVVYTAGV